MKIYTLNNYQIVTLHEKILIFPEFLDFWPKLLDWKYQASYHSYPDIKIITKAFSFQELLVFEVNIHFDLVTNTNKCIMRPLRQTLTTSSNTYYIGVCSKQVLN